MHMCVQKYLCNIYIHSKNLIPTCKTCLNWGKVATLAWLVLIAIGFNVSCSKSLTDNFASNVHSRNDLGSIILHSMTGSTYFTY